MAGSLDIFMPGPEGPDLYVRLLTDPPARSVANLVLTATRDQGRWSTRSTAVGSDILAEPLSSMLMSAGIILSKF